MKKYLIIVIIAILYILFAFAAPDLFDGNIYMFVGKKAHWIYKKGEWSNMANLSKNLGKFNIYDMSNGELIDKTNLYYENGKLLSKGDNILDKGFYMSFKGKSSIEFLSYKRNYDVNSKEILDVMKNVGIKNTDIPLASKIVIDLDDDGTDETIYELYNSTNYDENIKTYYTTVCIKDGNQYTKLTYKEDNYTFYNNYLVAAIIDFTNDGNYEIIVGESGISFDARDTSYFMFGIKDNKYVKLVSTE